ncbi:hypothetical protein V6N13_086158 [Hibiscus sabdariffa]
MVFPSSGSLSSPTRRSVTWVDFRRRMKMVYWLAFLRILMMSGGPGGAGAGDSAEQRRREKKRTERVKMRFKHCFIIAIVIGNAWGIVDLAMETMGNGRGLYGGMEGKNIVRANHRIR